MDCLNMITLKRYCLAAIESLEARHATVHPKNKDSLAHYYSDNCLKDIRRIVDSIHTNVLEYHSEYFPEGRDELHALRTACMASEIDTMKAQLRGPKY